MGVFTSNQLFIAASVIGKLSHIRVVRKGDAIASLLSLATQV